MWRAKSAPHHALSATELARRKPVWIALSDLWLDTEFTPADEKRVAAVLIASHYPVPELEEIYLYEVAPVVSGNLLAVAGVWQGFDEAWLCAAARRRAEQRALSVGIGMRLWVRYGLGRRMMTYATAQHWRAIMAHVHNAK